MSQIRSLLSRWLPEFCWRTDSRVAAPGNATASGSANIDRSIVNKLREVGYTRGTNLLNKAVKAYETEAPDLLNKAHKALEERRPTQLFDVAHCLKSTSADVGALTLSSLCAELEAAAMSEMFRTAPRLLHAIDNLLPKVVSELAELTYTPRATPATMTSRISGKTVLIVDDEASFRMILRAALLNEGFVVNEASNGDEAIESARLNRPDLLIVDAMMDGMDGFELCHYFRNSHDMANVPLVMVTGLDDVHSIDRARQTGADAFVTKPVNYPILIHQLRFVLHANELKAESDEIQLRLEAAQRLARLGYWVLDVHAGIFQLSGLLTELIGLDSDPVPTDLESFLQFVHADDRLRVQMDLETAIADGASPATEYRIVGAGGDSVFVRQNLAIRSRASGADFVFGTVQDISRQRHAEDQIRKLAYFDDLTGLASRSYLMQYLNETIKLAARRDEYFALLFLDLDSFKDINDGMGHDIGDRLLQIIAGRLQDVLRESDFTARFGGDEFCIVTQSHPDPFTMTEVAQRCLDAVGKPVDLLAQRIQPQMSIGIAQYPLDGQKAHQLVKAADSAMYAAKMAGKNRYAFYSPKMTRDAEDRLALDCAMRMAFERREFVLHYQPLISVSTGRVVGVEALVRWQHPDRGLVMPDKFIPTIERIGLINDLGNLVINAACAQLRDWQRSKLPAIWVSVNISATHFREPEIVDTIRMALDKYSLSAGDLELEITESVMQNETETREVLDELSRLGVKISIDDFGTGYSSLGSLKHLPIHRLKIDRVFIRDMVRDTEDTILLGAIVGLAHALDYTVVAEGVEELSQLQILAGIDCDIAQGFFFSKPVPASAIPPLLHHSFLQSMDQDDHANQRSRTGAG